jgi:hypothetical protein
MKSPLLKVLPVLLAVVPTLFIFSCKSDKSTSDNTRKAVDAPLVTNVPFRDFDVNADAGDTLKLNEGTDIFIPGGTFVDAKGAPVNGKVQLHYRAFYTAGQILASGIMMNYDTAGVSHIFTSAGMFELTGTQNGKPVSIANGKSITLNFASTRDDANVSFYQLDTAAAKWNFLATSKATANSIREKLMNELSVANAKPIEPKAFDASKPVIDIDVDVTDHPELAGYNGIVWQYAGIGNDPEKNKWIYNTEWSTVKMRMDDSTSCCYTMSLSNGVKNITTKVNPSLKGENYTRALSNFKSKMLSFQAMEKDRLAKLEQAAKYPPFRRISLIRSFGVHNCDAYAMAGTPVVKNGEFHFDEPDFENHKEDVTVFLINDRGRISSGFCGLGAHEFIYLSDKENCLVAVLKGTNRAEILNSKEFFGSVYDAGDLPVKFQMHSTTKAIADSNDLDMLISDL